MNGPTTNGAARTPANDDADNDIEQNPGFDDFARDLSGARGSDERLSISIDVTLEMVNGCDHVSFTEATRTGYTTKASSDPVAERADRWQYEFSEGPCVSSVREHETVLSQDLAGESRWPRWAPRVRDELGLDSVLSMLLYTHEHSFGAINLYGDRRNAFDSADLAVAHSVAAHLAVALAASNEIAHLGVAVHSRTLIGQAEGMLMERLQIDGDQAFAYLRRVSQDTNRKLVEVAAELVSTRTLPQQAEAPAVSPRPGPGAGGRPRPTPPRTRPSGDRGPGISS